MAKERHTATRADPQGNVSHEGATWETLYHILKLMTANTRPLSSY